MVSDPNIYWNPLLETLPQEKIKALQLKKFKRIVEWPSTTPPFITGFVRRQEWVTYN